MIAGFALWQIAVMYLVPVAFIGFVIALDEVK